MNGAAIPMRSNFNDLFSQSPTDEVRLANLIPTLDSRVLIFSKIDHNR